jgi:hypothetical protein
VEACFHTVTITRNTTVIIQCLVFLHQKVPSIVSISRILEKWKPNRTESAEELLCLKDWMQIGNEREFFFRILVCTGSSQFLWPDELLVQLMGDLVFYFHIKLSSSYNVQPCLKKIGEDSKESSKSFLCLCLFTRTA